MVLFAIKIVTEGVTSLEKSAFSAFKAIEFRPCRTCGCPLFTNFTQATPRGIAGLQSHNTMHFRHIGLLALALLHTAVLDAQRYVRTTLPNQQLLPVSHITAVMQDEEGYFWYATPGGGLCRDNGYAIDVIRSDRLHPGRIANNDVLCVAEDTAGNSILFGTAVGMYRVDKHDYGIGRVAALGDRAVFRIARDAEGRTWVCTRDSAFVLDGRLRRTNALRLPRGASGAALRAEAAPDGTLWMVGGGMLMSVGTRGIDRKVLPPDVVPTCLVPAARKGCYWMGTERGIRAMQAGAGGKVSVSSLQIEGRVDHLATNGSGQLWALVDGRLRLFDTQADGLVERCGDGGWLPERETLIDGIYADRSGCLWVYGQSPHTFILSPYERGIVDESRSHPDVPRNIYCQMTSGTELWAWQWRKPMVVYDRVTGCTADVQEACPEVGTFHYGFSRRADGRGIWNGTVGGEVVHLWTDGGKVRHEVAANIGGCVTATCETEGHRLWIGSDCNLYCYDTARGRLHTVADGIGCVTQMQLSADGWLYFTVEGRGLARADRKMHWEWMVRDMVLTDVVEDARGQLWTASKLGEVYRVDTRSKTLEEDTLAGNVNGDIIYMMEADLAGHLWILSDQHLKEYNPETGALRVLRCTDPDIGMECFQNICLTDGMICLSGLGGYRLVEPSAQLDYKTTEHIHPALSGYRVNGTFHFCGKGQREIRLRPSDTSLWLDFTTFGIVGRDNIQFACRLDGWDKDWKTLPAGVNGIQYINLQHGNYTLLLRATDAYGRWSAPTAVLSIRRLPAWWETMVFRATLCIVVVLLVGVVLHLYIVRKFRHRVFLHGGGTQQSRLLDVSQSETEFLEKAQRVVERHMGDTGFSVEVFSSKMCMSRMNLYRKMQMLTGLSPSDYIRTIRLRKAVELMKTEIGSMSEVADRVGFSSPAYFSKCFRDRYGMSPSQWKASQPDG